MSLVAGQTRDTTATASTRVSILGLQPRRVAVLRALQIGDLLCAVPALRALRAALPDRTITLVGLSWAREFAARFNHYIDEFLELPGYPGLPERQPDIDSLPGFLEEAQHRRFDLVVQLHGSGEITNPLALLLGGQTTVGCYRPGQFCPDPAAFLPYPDGEPEVRRPLRLLQWLGVSSRGEYLEFPLSDADRRAAHEAAGHLAKGRYACIHPGARAADRRWPADAFARVADAVAARGLHIVLTGSAEEAHITHEVGRRMHAHATDLAGRTPLGATGAILSRAQLLVCNDTGVSHIADALGVPSVVVFTASEPKRWAPLDRAKHRIVRAPAPASNSSMTASVERAIAEANDLLRAEGRYAA